MASRNGLSKREVKRASAAKALTAKKSSVKSSPRVAPLAGAGPLMQGQTRVANSYGGGSQLQGAGPLLQGQTRVKDSYSGDSAQRRKEAAKAIKSEPSLLDRASNWLQEKSPLHRMVGEAAGDYVETGSKKSLGKVMAPFAVGAAIPAGMFAAGAGAAGGMSSLAGVGRGIMGRGGNLFKSGVKNFGDDVVSKIPSNAIPIAGAAMVGSQAYVPGVGTMIADTPFADTEDSSNDGTDGGLDGAEKSIFKRPQSTDIDNAFKSGGLTKDEDSNIPVDASQDEVANPEIVNQLINEQYGGDPLADTPGSTTRPLRGSGMFATGKGTQGNPLLDEYQSQLKGFRKQGNKMEDLYDDMLKSLDPTYDAYSADIKKSVDEELRQNLLQLASVMNANNTGDSEQRAQFMAQRQGQSEAQLGDLLRKLMLQKQEDAMGIREKKSGALERLQDRQMTTREKMAGLMAELEKGRTKGGSGSLKKNANLIALMQKAANMTSGGADWARRNAETYGVDPSSLNLTGNWGDGFRDAPKATSPQRSTAPRPTKIDDGVYIDGNPYSPTYGQQLEWQD